MTSDLRQPRNSFDGLNSPPHLWKAELGILVSDNQVTIEDHFQTTTIGIPNNGSDKWFSGYPSRYRTEAVSVNNNPFLLFCFSSLLVIVPSVWLSKNIYIFKMSERIGIDLHTYSLRSAPAQKIRPSAVKMTTLKVFKCHQART